MTADPIAEMSAVTSLRIPPAALARVRAILAGARTFDTEAEYLASYDTFGPYEPADYIEDER